MPADISIRKLPFDEKKVMKELNSIGVMEKRNVTVAYPGTKKVGGIDTGEPCIVVGVHDKMHRSLLKNSDLIPKELPSGVKTDVVVMDRIKPLSRTSPATPENYTDPYNYWYDSFYFDTYQSQTEGDDPNCAGDNMYPGGGSFPWLNGCPLHCWKHRPLIGGVSISTYWDGEGTNYGGTGTLCAVVKDKADGKIVLLTNNHVLAREVAYYDTNYSAPVDGEQSIEPLTYVIQPSRGDYNYWYRVEDWTDAGAEREAVFQALICGEVKRAVSIQFGTDSGQDNQVDCAIASINQSLAYHGIFEAHVGPYPFAARGEYDSGTSVYISSRTTGYRSPDDSVSPYILSKNATINVQYAAGDSGIGKFTDQMMITSEEGNVSRSGDSGSPVLVYASNIFKLAGIVFAGGGGDYNSVYANHIDNVAEQINVEAWDGSITINPDSYGAGWEDTCYHKIKTVKRPLTHSPDYLYGNCEECEDPVTFSFADEEGAEIINSIWEVPVKGEATAEKTVYLWFDRGDPQDRTPADDCSDGQYKITDVRISVANMDGSFSGGTNQQGQECVDEKWISIRSDGVRTHYCDEMLDDNQSTFKSVGGGFTDTADYLAVGDFCADSARRIFIKVTVPEGVESEGAVFPKLVVQYNVENESSSSESSSLSVSSSSLSSSSVSSSSISSSESKSSSSSVSSSSESVSSSSESISSSSSSSESSESSSESSSSESSTSSVSQSSSSISESVSSTSSSSSSESSSSVSSLSSSSSSESVSSSSSSSESSESSSESSESVSSSSSFSSSSAESKSSSSSSSSLSESKSSSSSSSESESKSSSSSSSESSLSSSSSSESSSSESESKSSSSSSESSLSSSSSVSESVSSSSSSSSESVSSSSLSESESSSSSSLLPCPYTDGNVYSDVFDSLTGWSDNDEGTGVSSQIWFDGTHTFKISAPSSGARAEREKDTGTFDQDRYVVSVRQYIDETGTHAASASNGSYIKVTGTDGSDKWTLNTKWTSDGLFIWNGSTFVEAGDDVVDLDQWINWTFDCYDLDDADTAKVDVYKNGVLIETGMDMQKNFSAADGTIRVGAYNNNAVDLSYFDFIEIGTGCEDSWSLPSDSSSSSSSYSSESSSSESVEA